MREIEHFLNALRFLTIVPIPPSDSASRPDWLARSAKYFPVVGISVGAMSAVVWLLAEPVWGSLMAALLAVVASIVMTGALHEDGLADTADAFGGGWTVERRLEIMKDSRIGTYGALALGLGSALRVAALAQLPLWAGACVLVASHAAARATPIIVINAMRYAGNTDAMKAHYSETPVRSGEFGFAIIAVALGALPLALMSVASAVSGMALGAAFASALAMASRRLIHGYTGDVLGAVEQMFEIGFLLAVAAIIR